MPYTVQKINHAKMYALVKDMVATMKDPVPVPHIIDYTNFVLTDSGLAHLTWPYMGQLYRVSLIASLGKPILLVSVQRNGCMVQSSTIHISVQELLDRKILEKVATKEHVPFVPPEEPEEPQDTPWRNMPIKKPRKKRRKAPKTEP